MDWSELVELSCAGAPLDRQRAALRDGLRRRGIGEQAIAHVMASALDGIGLSTNLPAGAGRFGGPGVLPHGVEWPRLPGFPEWHLGFLMEIVLDGLPPAAPLPSSGRLLVFQDMESFGAERYDLGTTRVFFVDAAQPTVVCEPPSNTLWPLPAKLLGARALPLLGDPYVTAGAVAAEDRHAVETALDDLQNAQWHTARHRLLGAASEVQELLPEAIRRELAQLPPDQRARFSAELQRGDGWRLLLQVHGEDDADIGLSFGIMDAGALYICVPAEDLPAARFDRALGFAQTP